MLEAAASLCLAVFKSPTSVHEEPFQDSVTAETLGVAPAIHKAAVLLTPVPVPLALAVFISAISVPVSYTHLTLPTPPYV